MKGYVLVRYADEEVLPAVVEAEHKWVVAGDEVMLDERGDTAIAVTEINGIAEPEERVREIAALFHRAPEDLPRVIGKMTREYWNKKDDPEKDWRRDL